MIHDEALPNCKIDRQKKRMKEEEEDDWVGLDTTFFIAKIQSNYSNDGRIFFSFLLLVAH